MKKYSLNTPYVVKKFKHHEDIKETLLTFLDKTEFKSPNHEASETNITRADWFDATNMNRDWVQFVAPKLIEDIKVMYEEIGFDLLRITELWFQQYSKNSEHGWHTHSGNWTNVYYLELPKSTPKTLLIDPFDKKTIIEVPVEEGDLLLFPAFVMHKAPVNTSFDRKTILSYNIDADISDAMYKKWAL